jgi:hypothetical protein
MTECVTDTAPLKGVQMKADGNFRGTGVIFATFSWERTKSNVLSYESNFSVVKRKDVEKYVLNTF